VEDWSAYRVLESDYSEKLEEVGRIILKSIPAEEYGGVGWIQLIQDTDQ
jgi:hypothetical protein